MRANLTIIIDQLRPVLGKLADEFVAMQLSLVNRKYVTIIEGSSRLLVSLPEEIPHVDEEDLKRFMEVLAESLARVLGPQQKNKVMVDIYHELCKHYLTC